MLIGAAKISAEQIAQGFNVAFTKFMARNPTHLKKIDVVIFQQSMLSTFRSNISSTQQRVSPPHRNSSLTSIKTAGSLKSRLQALDNGVDSDHRIVFYITTDNEENYAKVSTKTSKNQ